MTTLLLLALLILAPTTAFAQTGPAAASEPQPTSSANPPAGRFQDFLDRAVLSPGAVRDGVGRLRHRRDVEHARLPSKKVARADHQLSVVRIVRL